MRARKAQTCLFRSNQNGAKHRFRLNQFRITRSQLSTNQAYPFAQVAQRCGVYTSFDYADIVEHLVRYWKVREQKNLSAEAEAAQQYLSKLPDRVRRLAERTLGKAKKGSPARVGKFSWVFNREVPLL